MMTATLFSLQPPAYEDQLTGQSIEPGEESNGRYSTRLLRNSFPSRTLCATTVLLTASCSVRHVCAGKWKEGMHSPWGLSLPSTH